MSALGGGGEERTEASQSATLNARAEGEERARVGRPRVDFALPQPPLSSSAASAAAGPTPLPSCEYRPYLLHPSPSSSPSSSSRVLVCASVNGGNAFEWLARCALVLQAQLSELSPTPSASPPASLATMYSLLLREGLHHFAQQPELSFQPSFLPDRWAPSHPRPPSPSSAPDPPPCRWAPSPPPSAAV